MRYSVFNVDVMQMRWHEDLFAYPNAIPLISREHVNMILPEVRDVEEENRLPPFRMDEMEFGEREAEFSRQPILQHSEIGVNADCTQRPTNLDNRVMRFEKIVPDLQAQPCERNKTCTNHDTISKDIEVCHRANV